MCSYHCVCTFQVAADLHVEAHAVAHESEVSEDDQKGKDGAAMEKVEWKIDPGNQEEAHIQTPMDHHSEVISLSCDY